jgi:hypothetical protein
MTSGKAARARSTQSLVPEKFLVDCVPPEVRIVKIERGRFDMVVNGIPMLGCCTWTSGNERVVLGPTAPDVVVGSRSYPVDFNPTGIIHGAAREAILAAIDNYNARG